MARISRDWKAWCPGCGFIYKASQLKMRWDGVRVCKYCWETRHPQEFIKGIPDRTLPWTSPEPRDIEIDLNEGFGLIDESILNSRRFG